MGNKYSDLKRYLKIDAAGTSAEGLAYVTHYLQGHSNGTSEYFRQQAADYLCREFFGMGVTDDRICDRFVPVSWDIPFSPPKKPKFTFVDLFAGIGGIRLAYQSLGGKCVYSSEWDKHSRRTYEANFGEVPFGDITQVDERRIPDHDILLAGFPCQPFSIAGVSKKNALGRNHWFLDETQGTLFFDIARIIKRKKPAAFMLENVKNLVAHDGGTTFRIISNTLSKLGYTLHRHVLDSKYYVPQHRERIIIVGFRKSVFRGKEQFGFPKYPRARRIELRDLLEREPDTKYTLSEDLWTYLQNYALKHREKGNGFGYGLIDVNGVTRTLSARYYKDGSEILIPQAGPPRRLTLRECARLQGFPDTFLIPVSDTQAYRQFGNSVTVPLIQAVGKNIVREMLEINAQH